MYITYTYVCWILSFLIDSIRSTAAKTSDALAKRTKDHSLLTLNDILRKMNETEHGSANDET